MLEITQGIIFYEHPGETLLSLQISQKRATLLNLVLLFDFLKLEITIKCKFCKAQKFPRLTGLCANLPVNILSKNLLNNYY